MEPNGWSSPQMLHRYSASVRSARARRTYDRIMAGHLLTTGMSGYTQNGVIGRPSLASAEKGKALLASFVESFASVLEILRKA